METATMEINTVIAAFATHFRISVSEPDMADFLREYNARRSLMRISLECIGVMYEFLLPYEMLPLARSCKYTYSDIGRVHRLICSVWHPTNLFDGVDSTYIWKQMCTDWYLPDLPASHYGSYHHSIVRLEKALLYGTEQLGDFLSRRTERPLPSTLLAIKTYTDEINANTNLLEEAWQNVCQMYRDRVDYIKWMIPSGFLSDLPKLDNRLYGGITREEFNQQQNPPAPPNRERFGWADGAVDDEYPWDN